MNRVIARGSFYDAPMPHVAVRTRPLPRQPQLSKVSCAPASRLRLDECAQTSLASHWPETILSKLRLPDRPLPGHRASIHADPGPFHTESLAAHPKAPASTHPYSRRGRSDAAP